MKKAAIITTAVILTLGTLIGAGYAVGNRFHKMTPAQRADMIANRITKELDLSAKQKEKLNAMKSEIVDKLTRLHEDRESHRGEVLALIKSDRVTEKDIARIMDRHEAKMHELKPFVIDTLIEFHTMLTPAQRNKLAEKLESFHEKGCRHE